MRQLIRAIGLTTVKIGLLHLEGEMSKTCTQCKEIRPIAAFYRRKDTSDGLAYECISCFRGRVKKWQKLNSKKFRKQQAGYKADNKITLNKQQAKYRRLNRANITSQQLHRRRTDPQTHLAYILRNRLYQATRNDQKAGSAVRDLGCSIDYLKQHLELQFQEGMTWENYGLWHIDHKKPLASFDLTDREQFLEACHYTNLQPLWAIENLSKGSKQ